MQTLTKLDLGNNEIGALGAEHLAKALCVNKVAEMFTIFIHIYQILLMQTLITLNFGGEDMGNIIGPAGTKQIANALRLNQVIETALFICVTQFFSLLFRH